MVEGRTWRLEPTGSSAGLKKMDGIWHVMVPVMTFTDTLEFKALLPCQDTERCLRVLLAP